MANEFVAKNGLISKSNVIVSGYVTASAFSGSIYGGTANFGAGTTTINNVGKLNIGASQFFPDGDANIDGIYIGQGENSDIYSGVAGIDGQQGKARFANGAVFIDEKGALTASFVQSTSSWAQAANTASYISGSIQFSGVTDNYFPVWQGGVLSSTSSLINQGSALSSSVPIKALLTSTASWANTASYAVRAGNTVGTGSTYPFTASWAVTASQALTTSVLTNNGTTILASGAVSSANGYLFWDAAGNFVSYGTLKPANSTINLSSTTSSFYGNVIISSDGTITASRVNATASWAVTSSRALTASLARTASVLYNSNASIDSAGNINAYAINGTSLNIAGAASIDGDGNVAASTITLKGWPGLAAVSASGPVNVVNQTTTTVNPITVFGFTFSTALGGNYIAHTAQQWGVKAYAYKVTTLGNRVYSAPTTYLANPAADIAEGYYFNVTVSFDMGDADGVMFLLYADCIGVNYTEYYDLNGGGSSDFFDSGDGTLWTAGVPTLTPTSPHVETENSNFTTNLLVHGALTADSLSDNSGGSFWSLSSDGNLTIAGNLSAGNDIFVNGQLAIESTGNIYGATISGSVLVGSLAGQYVTGTVTSASYAKTASYAARAGNTVGTGSTYPFTSSWAVSSSRAITSSYADGPWLTLGNNLYYTNGFVGIGTNTPSSSLHIKTSNWAKGTLETIGVTALARQGSDQNGLNFTSNALFNGSWGRDDATKAAFAYIQHLGNSRMEFRTAAVSGDNTISWNIPMTIADNGTITVTNLTSTGTITAPLLAGTASFAVTASQAITASFAFRAGNTVGTGSTYPFTSSWANTSSWAVNALAANYAPGTMATGSTYPITASQAVTASFAFRAGNTVGTGSTYPFTSSWAATSSWTNALTSSNAYVNPDGSVKFARGKFQIDSGGRVGIGAAPTGQDDKPLYITNPGGGGFVNNYCYSNNNTAGVQWILQQPSYVWLFGMRGDHYYGTDQGDLFFRYDTSGYVPLILSTDNTVTASSMTVAGSLIVNNTNTNPVNDPTGLYVTVSYDGSGAYIAMTGQTYGIRLYTYRIASDGTKVYCATPAESSVDTGGSAGDGNPFSGNITWDAVPGVDGYKLVVYNDYLGWVWDHEVDLASDQLSFYDYTSGLWSSPVTTSPQTPYNIIGTSDIKSHLNIEGNVNIGYSNFTIDQSTGNASSNGNITAQMFQAIGTIGGGAGLATIDTSGYIQKSGMGYTAYGITASLYGTSSVAQTALTASYISGSLQFAGVTNYYFPMWSGSVLTGTSSLQQINNTISSSLPIVAKLNGTASWAVTASYAQTASYVNNYQPFDTIATSSTQWITASFALPNQYVNITTAAAYSFTCSNMPATGQCADLMMFINNTAAASCSLSFPSSWINMGNGWTGSLAAGKDAILWLRAFNSNSVVGTFNVQN